MQTFLPYPNFKASAEVLDRKRCWKQVVEASQIINVLQGKTRGWKHHPAVKMWEGYLPALIEYYNTFLIVSVVKHGINTKLRPKPIGSHELIDPWWLGDENFHRAIRARLIEKNQVFYEPLFPEDIGFNGGKYFWPDNKTETFKII